MNKSELQARVVALEAQLAQLADVILESNALKARLAVGHTVCNEQRIKIADLEAKLATRGCIATEEKPLRVKRFEPKVTLWTNRQGKLCETTRIGNQSRTRIIAEAQ